MKYDFVFFLIFFAIGTFFAYVCYEKAVINQDIFPEVWFAFSAYFIAFILLAGIISKHELTSGASLKNESMV